MSRQDFDRLFAAGSLRYRPVVGYGLAVGSAAAGLGLRELLGDSFPSGFPFLTFFPAIIVTAYLAGTGPGTVCAVIAALCAWFFLIPPFHSFSLEPSALMAMLFFSAVAAVDIALIAAMHRTLDRLSAERLVTSRLYEQQRTLFEELQHRVANNMAFVSSLLRLQKRRVAADPANAAIAFDEAAARIDTMGRIHRRLHDPGAANNALQAHLQAVCDDLVSATGATAIDCRVDVPDLQVGLDRLLPLSLLVAEIVTNSLKHGFAGRDRGRILITLEDNGDGRVLVIRDDGIGLAPEHDRADGTGLGMRIVQGLAAQIGGAITMSRDNGTVTRVSLPA